MLFADAKYPQAALSLADLQSMWGSQDTARRASAGDPELTVLAQISVDGGAEGRRRRRHQTNWHNVASGGTEQSREQREWEAREGGKGGERRRTQD